ncbi:hypothetical protein B9Z55_008387 [Caenorhabditis nigoni]|uniref:Uncharacterized protein n=1 Tax=Caenorhabditis nigoni TaxID=1611254 RepID=A0A2G5UML3_9PELO|nr:hypothetical protein B9Z55_008387 [Caenorhabditis nigoni]
MEITGVRLSLIESISIQGPGGEDRDLDVDGEWRIVKKLFRPCHPLPAQSSKDQGTTHFHPQGLGPPLLRG